MLYYNVVAWLHDSRNDTKIGFTGSRRDDDLVAGTSFVLSSHGLPQIGSSFVVTVSKEDVLGVYIDISQSEALDGTLSDVKVDLVLVGVEPVF
jgi:hypothetical protein